MTLETMRKRQKGILMFKILNGLTTPYLSEMFTHSASFHNVVKRMAHASNGT